MSTVDSWNYFGTRFPFPGNQLGISWGPEGALQLRDEQDPSIQTAEEITNPTVKLAAKTVIPPQNFSFGHSINNIAPM